MFEAVEFYCDVHSVNICIIGKLHDFKHILAGSALEGEGSGEGSGDSD